MTVTVYRSSDGSAPALNNLQGSLVAFLDAILVDGYAGKASQGWTKNSPNTCTGTATGGANNKLIDTGSDFIAKGVFIGQGAKRNADGKIGYVTSISTTTNPNDTLNYSSGATAPTFANLDAYTILTHRRVYTPPAGSNQRPLMVSDYGFGSPNYGRGQGYESFTGFVPGKATGGANNKCIDTTKEFVVAGVVAGNWVRRTADNKSAQITSISTTTNANDTLNFTAGTYTPTFGANDGYEVIVGIGQFPTDTQMLTALAGGVYFFKSNSATARDWIVVGNGKMFYHCVCYGGTATSYYGQAYGDFTSLLSGDTYNTVLWGSSSITQSQFGGKNIGGTGVAIYVPRSYLGTGTAVNIGVAGCQFSNANYMGFSGFIYPNPEDSKLYLGKIMLYEGAAAPFNLRGTVPGLWEPIHARTNFTTGDTCNGAASSSLNGKTFECVRMDAFAGVGYVGIFLETSDTW